MNQDLQDFEDYGGRLRFGINGHLKIVCFIPFFSRLYKTKALSNNNLSSQTGDVFGLEVMVIRRGLLFIILFADALRIGEKDGNESTV